MSIYIYIYIYSLVLCQVTNFCVVFKVCFWIIFRLEDQNMAYNKKQSQSLIFFICWYLIESGMSVSKQYVQDIQQKPQH